MKFSRQRRLFLTGSAAAAAALGLGGMESVRNVQDDPRQEFYELRVYRIPGPDKQGIVGDYLARALLPALNRMGVDRVGVFSWLKAETKDPDSSLLVLIPYKSLDLLAGLSAQLAADTAYQKSAAGYLALPKENPAYVRIESRLMKAFTGMPVMELPQESAARKPRVFEIRIYESHNEDAAWRKVEMFNSGEIQIMRDVKLAPVFYGETLISDDVPNLTYMLSATDMESHRAHWDAFRNHPEWIRMKKIERYNGIVSKITNWFLAPTEFSQV